MTTTSTALRVQCILRVAGPPVNIDHVKICSSRAAYKNTLFLKDSSLLFRTGKQLALCTAQIKGQGQPHKLNPLIPPNHWRFALHVQKNICLSATLKGATCGAGLTRRSRIPEPLLLRLARDDSDPYRFLLSVNLTFLLCSLYCFVLEFSWVDTTETGDTVQNKTEH